MLLNWEISGSTTQDLEPAQEAGEDKELPRGGEEERGGGGEREEGGGRGGEKAAEVLGVGEGRGGYRPCGAG